MGVKRESLISIAVLKREQAPVNRKSPGFPINEGMSVIKIHKNISKTSDRDFPRLL